MAFLLKVTCLLIYVPFVISETDNCTLGQTLSAFENAVFKFSTEITPLVANTTEYHFAISPFSIWNLLRLVSSGARNTTLHELQQVLYLPSRCQRKPRYKLWLYEIFQKDKVTIERSEVVIANPNLKVNEGFKCQIQHSGGGKMLTPSFENITTAVSHINEKIKKFTHGLITDAVTPEELSEKHMILLDFMYFKGDWRKPFQKNMTEVQNFFDHERNTIGKVNMMLLHSRFRLKYVEKIQASIIELPYASKRFSMLIISPTRGTTLQTVIKHLMDVDSSDIFDLGKPRKVAVEIPRFKMDFELKNLEDVLSSMGLIEMFGPEADFGRIFDEGGIFVSGFSQKCSVEVNENGTVAAAVTKVGYESRMGPPIFKADSPFLYLVVENTKRLPLFVGAYSKPI